MSLMVSPQGVPHHTRYMLSLSGFEFISRVELIRLPERGERHSPVVELGQIVRILRIIEVCVLARRQNQRIARYVSAQYIWV